MLRVGCSWEIDRGTRVPKSPGKYWGERRDKPTRRSSPETLHSQPLVSTVSVSCEFPVLRHASPRGRANLGRFPAVATDGSNCLTHVALLCVDHGTMG